MTNIFTFVQCKLNIIDVIKEDVELIIKGNYYKGLCPFCDSKKERTCPLCESVLKEEKQPFTISPKKGIFYCFSCHAGGDLVAYIAKKENVSHLDAAMWLADKYKLKIPEDIRKKLEKENWVKKEEDGQ